jgi:Calcium/calmodulin dependent protein kinase II association domain
LFVTRKFSTLIFTKLNSSRFLILLFFFSSSYLARRQEIIKMTEQLIEAINNGDFDAYT